MVESKPILNREY